MAQQTTQQAYESADPLGVAKQYKTAPNAAYVPDPGTGEPMRVDASGANAALLVNPAQEEASAKDWAGKQAAKKASEARQASYENYIQQIANSPWTTAANALTSTMTADLQAVAPATTGSTGPAAENAAASQGLGMLGLSPSSSAGQWLSSQTAAAQANAAPVAAAMQAEGQTYANMAGPITNAITQWGQDNAITNMTAPEASWLSALASHVTSNLAYQSGVPKADIGGLPYPVVQAIQQSGGAPGSVGSGLVPIQDIGKGQGQSSVVTTPTGGIGSPATAAGVPGGVGITTAS